MLENYERKKNEDLQKYLCAYKNIRILCSNRIQIVQRGHNCTHMCISRLYVLRHLFWWSCAVTLCRHSDIRSDFVFFFFKWPVLSVSFGLVFGNIYHLLVAIDRSMCVACVDGIIHALSENEDRVAWHQVPNCCCFGVRITWEKRRKNCMHSFMCEFFFCVCMRFVIILLFL